MSTNHKFPKGIKASPGFQVKTIGRVRPAGVAALGAALATWSQARALLGFKRVAGYMVGVGVIFLMLRESLMRVFTADETVVRAEMLSFVCVAIYQAFDAAFLTFSHTLRGAGDTLYTSLLMLASGAVVLVGGSPVLVRWAPGLESLGPWLATTAHAIVFGLGRFLC